MKSKLQKQLEAEYRQARYNRDRAARRRNTLDRCDDNNRGLHHQYASEIMTYDARMLGLNARMVKEGIPAMVYRPAEEYGGPTHLREALPGWKPSDSCEMDEWEENMPGTRSVEGDLNDAASDTTFALRA